jgi:hypothetical protein
VHNLEVGDVVVARKEGAVLVVTQRIREPLQRLPDCERRHALEQGAALLKAFAEPGKNLVRMQRLGVGRKWSLEAGYAM